MISDKASFMGRLFIKLPIYKKEDVTKLVSNITVTDLLSNSFEVSCFKPTKSGFLTFVML